MGGSAPTPEFWSWLGGEVSTLWPNGDTDRIRVAGYMWKSIATDLKKVRTRLQAAIDTLNDNHSAESDAIRTSWATLASGLSEAENDCNAVATNCRTHADNIDDTHSQIINALVQFAAGVGITAIVAAGLTPFTLGASDLAGAALVAGEVAGTVATVTTIAARFLTLCRAAIAELNVIRFSVAEWRVASPALATAGDTANVGRISGTAISIARETMSATGRVLMDVALGGTGARGIGSTDALAAQTVRHGLADVAETLADVPGVSIVGDKVLIDGVEKMTTAEWQAIRDASVHNIQSNEATLGKWVGEVPDSYTHQARKAGRAYFDLGAEWGGDPKPIRTQ